MDIGLTGLSSGWQATWDRGTMPWARSAAPGGVVEWLMAPVLKTGEVKASVGSNPTPSAFRTVISADS